MLYSRISIWNHAACEVNKKMVDERDLNTTGERLVPADLRTLEEHLGYLRHVFAYEDVKRRLSSDDRVVEIGGGEGYGTRMLSEACAEVIGLDVQADVVEYANKRYGSDRCRFELYDGMRAPHDDAFFDAAVSFQVIEHIQDDDHFIGEIHRLLKPGGTAYITTPNRDTRLKPGQRPWNRFHIREYSRDNLAELLSRHFEYVTVDGISAIEEIMKLEARRVRQGPLLRFALSLGMRQLIPEKLDPYVARLMGRLRGQKKVSSEDQALKDKYSVDDFRVETEQVTASLDLYARATKG